MTRVDSEAFLNFLFLTKFSFSEWIKTKEGKNIQFYYHFTTSLQKHMRTPNLHFTYIELHAAFKINFKK